VQAAFTFVAANDKKQRLAGMMLYGAAVPEIIYCLRIGTSPHHTPVSCVLYAPR
jgi:hypothetical protein